MEFKNHQFCKNNKNIIIMERFSIGRNNNYDDQNKHCLHLRRRGKNYIKFSPILLGEANKKCTNWQSDFVRKVIRTPTMETGMILGFLIELLVFTRLKQLCWKRQKILWGYLEQLIVDYQLVVQDS